MGAEGTKRAGQGVADLAPFKVTSPPRDVTAFGYSGKHLELTVPDLPVEGEGGDDRRFTGCEDGKLKSWVAFIDTAEEGDAVLRLHRPWLQGGVLDPRRRRDPSDDCGGTVPRLAARGPRRTARHPRLHPDRVGPQPAHGDRDCEAEHPRPDPTSGGSASRPQAPGIRASDGTSGARAARRACGLAADRLRGGPDAPGGARRDAAGDGAQGSRPTMTAREERHGEW
jgi:hypothetical protein